MHKMAAPNGTAPTGLEAPLSTPKYGTLIPNRIFVGGISGDTTESDLCRVFSSYGNVKSTKIIVDRAGVSKGYGFVTFETEQEAQRLQTDGECVVLRDRKLNIAPAIKKQSIVATNGAVYYATTPPAPIGNMPIDQFATAVYPPGAAGGMPALYPPSMQYQPFYQYYSVPMNVPTIWPQNYQERENRDRGRVNAISGDTYSFFNGRFLKERENRDRGRDNDVAISGDAYSYFNGRILKERENRDRDNDFAISGDTYSYFNGRFLKERENRDRGRDNDVAISGDAYSYFNGRFLKERENRDRDNDFAISGDTYSYFNGRMGANNPYDARNNFLWKREKWSKTDSNVMF